MAFKIFDEGGEKNENRQNNKINNKRTSCILNFTMANGLYNKICGDRIRINQTMWTQFYQSYTHQDMNYSDSFHNFKNEFLSIRRQNGLQRKRRREQKKELKEDKLW